MTRPRTFDQILRLYVSPEPNTGCWLWTGSENGRGYGRVRWNGSTRQAHRVTYSELVGPIPDGHEMDHLCRVTFCVNPDHLDPVDHRTNIQRGITGAVNAARQRAKTHCPRGHEYDDKNTVIRPNGSRGCKQCRRDKAREREAKRRLSSDYQKYIARRRRPGATAGSYITHCKRGHPLDGPDVQRNGKLRICLLCRRLRDKRRRPPKSGVRRGGPIDEFD